MTRSNRFPLKKVVLFSLLVSSAAVLGACNTMEGLGQDVRAGGRAIERTAQ